MAAPGYKKEPQWYKSLPKQQKVNMAKKRFSTTPKQKAAARSKQEAVRLVKARASGNKQAAVNVAKSRFNRLKKYGS